MMASNKATPALILVFINVGIVFGVALGYRNYNVDRLSLFTIAGLSLLVLNGMFLLLRRSEPDLPSARLKQLNKWIVWPIVLLAGLTVLIELFCGRR
jgi:amino acid transporter